MNLEEKEIKQELKRFIGDAPLLYLKHVMNEKRAKDLYNGKLYMNTVKFFRELEEKTGKRGQGDRHELLQSLKLTNGRIINYDTNGVFLEFSAANATIEIKGDQDKYLYCISEITVDDLELSESGKSSVEFKLPFTKQLTEKLKKDFGEYVVLINGPGFRQKIYSLINEGKVQAIFGKVKYCEPNTLQRMEAYNTFSAERFLYKDIDLAYQKEYRLAVSREFVKGNYFNIGSLKNISRICKINDLINYRVRFDVVWERDINNK